MSRLVNVKETTLGTPRYLTYFLIFPDGDEWWEQVDVIGPLSSWLRLTAWADEQKICTDILRRGESRWKDKFGVTHLVKIETTVRNTNWGTKRKLK